MRQKESITFRDLQRAMAHGLDTFWIDQALLALGATAYQRDGQYQEYRPMVDRLVARYGPKTRIDTLKGEKPLTSGERREKQTSEVAPTTSQTTNEKHGGEGASSEVPDGRSTQGDADSRQVGDSLASVDRSAKGGGSGGAIALQEQNGQGTADHSASRTGQVTLEQAEETGEYSTSQVSREQTEHGPSVAQDSADSYPGSDVGQQTNGGERAAEHSAMKKASSEAGNDDATASRSTRQGDTADCSQEQQLKQAGVGAEDATEKTSSSLRALRRLERKASAPISRHATSHHGGVFDELARHRIDARLVSYARAMLASWLADGSDDEQSHRWDYPELAARILTKRTPYPARRQELGRPALLVLADVSGSCAGFSHQSLLLAKAVATLGLPGCDVVLVAHSNGCPTEVTVNSRSEPRLLEGIEEDWYDAARFVSFYRSLVARFGLTHVIALGDHDAVNVYASLACQPEIQALFWLDNYNCNNQKAALSRPEIPSAQARRAIRYVVGCQSATDFLRGILVALHG